jgi:hypothetical protein
MLSALSETTRFRMLASATLVSALAPQAWAATISAAPDDEPMATPPVAADVVDHRLHDLRAAGQGAGDDNRLIASRIQK